MNPFDYLSADDYRRQQEATNKFENYIKIYQRKQKIKQALAICLIFILSIIFLKYIKL